MTSRRFWRVVFRTSLYLIVAALVLNTFMNRWGFRRRSPRYGFTALVTYEAHRPFAFRVLTPAAINAVTLATPRSLLDGLMEWDLSRVQEDHPPLSAHRRFGWGADPLPQHYVAYLALWPVVFLLLVAMRRLTRLQDRFSDAFVDVAPALALLALPLAFSRGGYVYDFTELLLVTVCVGLLLERRWILYYACFALACLNKETAILLVIYCATLHVRRLSSRALMAHAGLHGLVGVPILLWQRFAFAGNPGAGAEFQLWDNLRFLASPEPWLRFWEPYGPLLAFPGPFNLLSMAVFGAAVFLFWRDKPRHLRLAFALMTSVLLLLLVLFGNLDEVRNLSLAFPVAYLLACHTAARLYGLAGAGASDRLS
jgi:hypothetical protein